MRRLQADGVQFFIPAPVLAELRAGGTDGAALAEKLSKRATRLHIESLDKPAADLARRLIEANNS